ncbi:MAG: hypothetical protein HKN58_00780 [Xanthomonadales bacterium]|nr:hypothetical protein [Xanthomonadales bacterium]
MKPYLTLLLLLTALPRMAGAEVHFCGLDEAQELNARALMPLAEAPSDLPPWRVERLYKQSPADLERALEALGYYQPEIRQRLVRDEDCWHAHFDVTPGPPVRWRGLEVGISDAAASDPGVQALADRDRPRAGEVFNHGDYTRYKNGLLAAVNARGYFDAEYSLAEVRVEREALAADLRLQLAAGQRYRFGELSFTEGIIRQRILESYSDIRSGEPYSSESVNNLLLELNSSGYFGSVSIDTEPLDEADKTVPVTVKLTPGPRRIYSVGLGYATDTGRRAGSTSPTGGSTAVDTSSNRACSAQN